MQWVFGDTWGRMAIGSTLFLYLDPSAKMQYVNTFEWKSTKMYMKDKYDDGAPLAYFLRAKKTRAIHPETSDLLEKLLTMLRDKGEDYTFAYIRRLKKY